MDVVVKQYTSGNAHADMRIVTEWNMTFYRVTLYYYGKNYLDNIYHLDDKKNANACFYRYKRKADTL